MTRRQYGKDEGRHKSFTESMRLLLAVSRIL
jgi:hypothetical protein